MVPSNTRNWSLFQAKLAYQANGGSMIFLGGGGGGSTPKVGELTYFLMKTA